MLARVTLVGGGNGVVWSMGKRWASEWRHYGPKLGNEELLELEVWAGENGIDVPVKLLWDQVSRMDGAQYNHSPQKYLGL